MLKKYLKEYKVLVAISLILVIIQVWSMLYQPQLISDVITELSSVNMDQDKVNTLGITLIIVGFTGLIVGVLNDIVAAKVSQGIGAKIRKDSFRNIQRLSFEDIEKFSTSNLVVRLTNDVTQVQNVLMMGLQVLLRIPFLFLGSFILAIIALPGLWWTIILYVIVIAVITMFMGKKMMPGFVSIQKGIDDINTTVKENIDGVRVVKSFVTEKDEKKKFDNFVENLTSNYIHVGKLFSTMIPIVMFTANILLAFAIFFTANHAIDNPEMIGDLVSFTTYIMQLMFAIIMGTFMMMSISRAIVSVKRISEVLDAKPSFSFGEEDLNEVEELEFKDVSFKYHGEEEDMLKDISFKVKKGEKVGVVGLTGSGKSTLVQLIPRLYDVKRGDILINGKNIKEYSSKSLRNNISMVLQKAVLFSGTIKDVISQGNDKATELDIEMASKRAQAYEFIEKKENKFAGEVYQKGSNFSGGQKQRLSIARGLVKDPEILILDDSTSALDARSENLVKEAISKDFTGVMTFIVAQKIASVIDMDKIIVLDEGKIDGIGTHKELLKSSKVYKEIYETQKGKGE